MVIRSIRGIVRGIVHLHASSTLHQVFRCESASVERLQKDNKIDILVCIFLDPFLGLVFVVPKIFCFLLQIPTAVSELV